MEFNKTLFCTLTSFLLFSSASANGEVNKDLPDKAGMTIKGVVYCGNEPVKGAQVSDGINVTKTDDNGHYYLNSAKECGYVFVCNPKGYKYNINKKYPDFYKMLDTADKPDATEQVDFELLKDGGRNHVTLFLADIQMCKRNNDRQQYNDYAVPDINKSIDSYREKGNDVYVVTLGDQSYNTYWHNGFAIPEMVEELDKLKPDAIFNCMGNHDNSPDIAGDWPATEMYRKYWGPTYYSFNAGDIHYIVLDNIEYKNPEANRKDESYDCNITTQIIKWFRKDLANVSKDTPIVICMHAPLFKRPQCPTPDMPEAVAFRYNYGTQFFNSLSGYSDVRVLTGHSHTNHTQTKGKVTEYNVGGLCGNLWWTGYFVPGNSVCTDGSPAGYRVLEAEGKDIVTYYKSLGLDRNYQFRCYDLNRCHITGEKFAPNYSPSSDIDSWLSNGNYGFDNSQYNSDGSAKNPNRILVNVFAYDPQWKVEAIEEGTPLPVSRISGYDPMTMISDGCQRFDKTGHNTAGNPTLNSHLFLVQANTPDKAVTISVTDEYGNIFTRTMTRPFDLSIDNYIKGNDCSGIEFTMADEIEGTEVYYTLMGLKVDNPANGIYIRRKGSKTNKIFIK